MKGVIQETKAKIPLLKKVHEEVSRVRAEQVKEVSQSQRKTLVEEETEKRLQSILKKMEIAVEMRGETSLKVLYTDGLEKKVMSEIEQAFTVETHYENHIGSKPTIKHWIIKF